MHWNFCRSTHPNTSKEISCVSVNVNKHKNDTVTIFKRNCNIITLFKLWQLFILVKNFKKISLNLFYNKSSSLFNLRNKKVIENLNLIISNFSKSKIHWIKWSSCSRSTNWTFEWLLLSEFNCWNPFMNIHKIIFVLKGNRWRSIILR